MWRYWAAEERRLKWWTGSGRNPMGSICRMYSPEVCAVRMCVPNRACLKVETGFLSGPSQIPIEAVGEPEERAHAARLRIFHVVVLRGLTGGGLGWRCEGSLIW